MTIRTGPLPAEGLFRLPVPPAISRNSAAQASAGAVTDAVAADAPVITEVSAVDTGALAAAFSPLMSGLQQWCASLFGANTGGANPAATAPDAVAADAATPAGGGDPDYSGKFSLTVKTRDGDTVTIHFTQSRSDGAQRAQASSASYEVDGNLSADERKALDRLVGKMNDIADTFFSDTTGFGHLAVVDNLDFFDAGQLAGFALDLSQQREHMGNQRSDSAYSSLSFDYDVDLAAHTQRLRSDSVSGYSQAGGAGLHHYGYDVSSAIDASAKAALASVDVSGMGRPGLYQSAPTALPAYYQGALQALSGNIDALAALAGQSDAQAALAQPAQGVSTLFRGLAQAHPAYRKAAPGVRQGLDRVFALLPALMRNAGSLHGLFGKSGIRTAA